MHPMKEAVIASSVFTVIAFIFLIFRCISRFLIVRQVGADDVFAILGNLASVLFLACMIMIWKHGGGNYFMDLSPEDMTGFLKWFFVSVMCYAFAMTTIKGSALLQFLRFIKLGRMRTFCWVMVGIVFGFGIISVFVNVFSCRPITSIWDITITDKTCIKFAGWFWVWAWYIIATDFILVAIPIITFKDMNLPYRQKIALIIVFALGGVASIISLVRLQSVHQFATTGSDWSRHEPGLIMWSHIELSIGLVCIHTPPVKALVLKMFPRLLQERSTEQDYMDTQDSGLSGVTLAPSSDDQFNEKSSNNKGILSKVSIVSSVSSRSV